MSKARAYRLVRSAVEAGTLVRPECCSRCGAADKKATAGRHTIQAHHHAGYDRPLDVEWLCARCHRAETPLPAVIGGRAFGSANGASKLTEIDVAEIRASHLSGPALARIYRVDRKTIQRVRNNTHWLSAAPKAPPVPKPEGVEDAARFLLDRLVDHEVRMTAEEDAREWQGHVAPAMARLRAALSPSGATEQGDGE